jgi:hypothetical protein
MGGGEKSVLQPRNSPAGFLDLFTTREIEAFFESSDLLFEAHTE